MAVASNLRAIAEDAAVAHHGVVTDVSTLHEHVVVADDGLSATVGGTIDNDVLTNDVVVANDALRLLTTEVEVLWQGTNHGALMHLVATAHAGAIEDGDEGEDDAVVAYLYVVLYIHEGEYFTVVADLRLGRDLGSWTYFAV